MQPVVLVGAVHLRRVGRVAYHGVEVDDGVEASAIAYPVVDVLAQGLVEERVVVRVAHLGDGTTDHLEASTVSLVDELLVGGYQFLGSLFGVLAATDVVDALVDNDACQIIAITPFAKSEKETDLLFSVIV